MRTRVCAFVFATFLLVVGDPAQAVDLRHEHYIVAAYTPNIPNEFLGISVCRTRGTAAGLYLDMKWRPNIRTSSDPDYYDNISVRRAEEIFGDRLIDTEDGWITMNLALVTAISRTVAGYGGVGLTSHSAYRRYYDRLEILGDDGRYWIEDDSKSGLGLNVIAGCIFFLADGWTFQAGFEAHPTGLTLGLGRSYFKGWTP